MRTTIDGAGRVVIPKQLRDAAGLVPGQALLVERDGFLAAGTDEDPEPLTAEQVPDVLESPADDRVRHVGARRRVLGGTNATTWPSRRSSAPMRSSTAPSSRRSRS